MASLTPLFLACERGDLSTLTAALYSLSSSTIGDIRDEFSASLLHYAARYGHEDILRYLIESKRLNVSEILTEHGATCVHDAAVCDQLQAMVYLFAHLKRKSVEPRPLTLRDEQGNTPLHLGKKDNESEERERNWKLCVAAAYGSIRCLEYLLQNESTDPHRRSNNGFQPIHHAALNGYGQCVKLLLSAAPTTINERTQTLLTPISLACQAGAMNTIQLFATYGANCQLRDEKGLSCLHTGTQTSFWPFHSFLF